MRETITVYFNRPTGFIDKAVFEDSDDFIYKNFYTVHGVKVAKYPAEHGNPYGIFCEWIDEHFFPYSSISTVTVERQEDKNANTRLDQRSL